MKKLHFVGPVLTASGYGVHARQLLQGLVKAGEFDITVEAIRWGETPFLTEPGLEWIRTLAEKTAHANPDVCVQVTIPNEFKRRAPLTVGVTAGIETDRVSPQWIVQCNKEVDVVVVPSEHSRRGFLVEYQGPNGEKLRMERPIFVIPEGVDTDVYRPRAGERSELLDRLNVPEKNFFFVGLGLDKSQGRDRKNVSRLVEYFCKAFAGRTDVGLVLKLSIVNGSLVDYEHTTKRIADIKRSCLPQGSPADSGPPIFLVHGRVPDGQIAAIYNDPRVLAAVSITHGEGFGLPLIEAAACGVPVMATDWSGHLDFLTKNGKKLFVPFAHDLQEIFPESANEWMIQGTNWAVPRDTDVVSKLQKMALSSATPRQWATELSQHLLANYNVDRTAAAFVDLIRQGVSEMAVHRPTNREDFVSTLRKKVYVEGGQSLLYTMPMSAGDVFLSTSIVRVLREKHPGHRVYFATQPQYFPIAKGCADEVIEWQPWMQDVSIVEDIFTEAYTPNLAVQMAWSNWVHKGKGRNILEEFAVQCGLTEDDVAKLEAPRMAPSSAAVAAEMASGTWLAVHTGGQKSARLWYRWAELVKNIRAAGIKVLVVGAKDDVEVEHDYDARGIPYDDLPVWLQACQAFVGIDSFPMHVAAAYGVPTVALFGSSYAHSTGPIPFGRVRLSLIETENRNSCDRACYKDVCKLDASDPCINHITPSWVFSEVLKALEMPVVGYREYRPRISGYTHILNPATHGYPFVQSIQSMLGFCDEVIVVDGGSTDASLTYLRYNKLIDRAINDGRVKIIDRKWDPEEPGMDGMQKALGRAMCDPSAEFLWQQDADEVVHEDDYHKIIDICRRFPSDVDIVHLPVVELWGDDHTCRTDRHSWKWRLSRNNVRITHGINIHARQMDPKTGKVFSKPGMSDGCEYIDMVTGDHLRHRGFYDQGLDQMRQADPEGYGRRMNETFGKIPSVWHYSWADLPRKVRNFRDFWDKQWQVLYQSPPKPRFPDVVTDEDILRKAEELRERGGEHGRAPTFQLEQRPPATMRNFLHVTTE